MGCKDVVLFNISSKSFFFAFCHKYKFASLVIFKAHSNVTFCILAHLGANRNHHSRRPTNRKESLRIGVFRFQDTSRLHFQVSLTEAHMIINTSIVLPCFPYFSFSILKNIFLTGISVWFYEKSDQANRTPTACILINIINLSSWLIFS